MLGSSSLKNIYHLKRGNPTIPDSKMISHHLDIVENEPGPAQAVPLCDQLAPKVDILAKIVKRGHLDPHNKQAAGICLKASIHSSCWCGT